MGAKNTTLRIDDDVFGEKFSVRVPYCPRNAANRIETFANCAGAIKRNEDEEPAEPIPSSCSEIAGEKLPDNSTFTEDTVQNPVFDALI
jgi:hypothetical protein